MTSSHHPLPRVAQLLGYAGLIPFIALAVMAVALSPSDQALAAFALRAYAVTIVSFLGAIHWGFAMRHTPTDTPLFAWGVAPSLLGWIALLVLPALGSLLLAATLWLCFVVDRRVYPRYGLQEWLRMRLVLTVVASAACVVGGGVF